MIGVFAAATDIWAPIGVLGVPVIVMFGWLRIDIRDLGRRLERLESAHSQTEKAVARLQGGASREHPPAKWEG